MNDAVTIEIPVSPEAAAALADADRRSALGRYVSRMLQGQKPPICWRRRSPRPRPRRVPPA